MAEFINPFSGMVPNRKLNDRELARAVRLALAAEEEAVHLYEALADATDNPLAAKVLQDVADEERVHAGEFQELLRTLLPDEQRLLQEGADEVRELASEEKERKE
jgi:rubrerythrin